MTPERWEELRNGKLAALRPALLDEIEEALNLTEPHPTGCVCADCSGAALTADND